MLLGWYLDTFDSRKSTVQAQPDPKKRRVTPTQVAMRLRPSHGRRPIRSDGGLEHSS